MNIPDRPLGISTIEGPKAYKDAISYLERQKPLEPLDPSKGLFRVAADFQKAIQRKNLEDVDSVDIEKIIDKYGTFMANSVEPPIMEVKLLNKPSLV